MKFRSFKNVHHVSYLLLFLILLPPPIINAQYSLNKAYPNLENYFLPTEFVNAGDGTNRMFEALLSGKIMVFDNDPLVNTARTFIDLDSKISHSGEELGLLGLAFHPDYENNRYFYTHYIFDSTGSPSGHWIRISRFSANLTYPDSADINSELILLTIPTINSDHNGGKLAFGTDGYLYIAIGDGAGGGSEALDRTLLLGKILRINVDSASEGKNYSIPQTNPYYSNSTGYRKEIFAYGFRNPWKFSFDLPSNKLWLGDVGQSNYEEIDIVENGKNYGWSKMEGNHCFPFPGSCDTNGLNATKPVFEYSHSYGFSIVGGFVYRGSQLPELYGKYIYGDYVLGRIWALNYDGINPTTSTLLLDTTFYITSFGTDENNELYVCIYNKGIFKIANRNVITLDLNLALEGLYDSNTGRMVMNDTVTAFLHSVQSPFFKVDSAKILINKNTLNGYGLFSNAPSGTYYISIKHRNALETWSRQGGEVMTRGGTVSYNFTNLLSMSFGNNSVYKDNTYCIYSGDVNHDGNINLDDVIKIYNDAGIFKSGYIDSDLNGDNIPDLSDVLIAGNNSVQFISVKKP